MSIFRSTGALLFAATILCAAAPPAGACLNDRGVERGEREFRTRYEAPAPPTREATGGFSPWGVAGLSIGSGAVAGCVGIGLRRRKLGGE